MHRMNHLRNSGKTIILVTHDLDAVIKFCDRAMLLDKGRLLEQGRPDEVVQKYRALIFERERRYSGYEDSGEIPESSNLVKPLSEMPVTRSIPNIDHRFGNGDAELLGVALLNGNGEVISEALGGQEIIIRVSAKFHSDIDTPILGYTLRDRLGVELSACNTSYADQPLPPACKDQIITSDFRVTLPFLAPGSYSISPAVAKGSIEKHDMCDWIDNALVFTLRSEDLVYGMMRMKAETFNYLSEAVDKKSIHTLKHS
jgi:lipopolysaccharide transport system ATP-binding protein